LGSREGGWLIGSKAVHIKRTKSEGRQEFSFVSVEYRCVPNHTNNMSRSALAPMCCKLPL
jgi:hypothetical protein